jgi:hypothetical protein
MTGAVAMEKSVQRTIEEIATELVSDPRPNGPDGACNIDRFMYVTEVFGMEEIDFDQFYDFTYVTQCKDVDMVEAVKQVALLKIDFAHRMYDHGHIDIVEFNAEVSHLILSVQRINWHLDHLARDRPTPPFPFIH